MKINIVIPAYNEENRIKKTLENYCTFFKQIDTNKNIETKFLVVLNGCIDKTLDVVTDLKQKYNTIEIINLKESGKGLAIIEGFKNSLEKGFDLIGFVDADMATLPEYFYELIEKISDKEDVIFCSRYMRGSKIYPERPFVKKWGRKLVYNPLIKIVTGIKFKDFQCGAKLFKAHVIEKILPEMTMKDWAFDVEMIYLSKKHGFKMREIPTIWYDQEGSKLNMMSAGLKMLKSIIKLRKNLSHKK